jgi:hypothetical protein
VDSWPSRKSPKWYHRRRYKPLAVGLSWELSQSLFSDAEPESTDAWAIRFRQRDDYEPWSGVRDRLSATYGPRE